VMLRAREVHLLDERNTHNMASTSMNPILAAKAGLNNVLTTLLTNRAIADGSIEFLGVNAGQKNTSDIAARFLIAEQVRSAANKNYDNVKKEARDAGILGTEEDYLEGETCTVSSFSGFDITARKSAASEMADTTAVKNVVSKYVPAAKRDQALAECIKERKGAVTISVVVR
jgi:hypothetical protein